MKYKLYESLVKEVCNLEDRLTGKSVKLIYRYLFFDECPEEQYNDMADITFWSEFDYIKKFKNHRVRGNGASYIIFYEWYIGVFDWMSDEKAGQLFKKFADETLKTNYLEGKNVDEITMYYKRMQLITKRKLKEENAVKHDFSKIKEDFPFISWAGVDLKKEPYRNINCIKLYNYMKKHHWENRDMHISIAIEIYKTNT